MTATSKERMDLKSKRHKAQIQPSGSCCKPVLTTRCVQTARNTELECERSHVQGALSSGKQALLSPFLLTSAELTPRVAPTQPGVNLSHFMCICVTLLPTVLPGLQEPRPAAPPRSPAQSPARSPAARGTHPFASRFLVKRHHRDPL